MEPLKGALKKQDEPTNHLDLGAIDWLQRHLVDEYKGTAHRPNFSDLGF